MGICPLVGDTVGKLTLIPNMIYGLKVASTCKLSLKDEPMLD